MHQLYKQYLPAKALSLKKAPAFYDALSLLFSCQWRVQWDQMNPVHILTLSYLKIIYLPIYEHY
jgi:hypothetical protein